MNNCATFLSATDLCSAAEDQARIADKLFEFDGAKKLCRKANDISDSSILTGNCNHLTDHCSKNYTKKYSEEQWVLAAPLSNVLVRIFLTLCTLVIAN